MFEPPVFQFGDLSIAADFPLADLPQRHATTAEWAARIGRVADDPLPEPYHSWSDAAGRPLVAFARLGSRRIVTYLDRARFGIDPPHRSIVCEPLNLTSIAELGELLARDVLPLIAGVDRLTLHGSAVALSDRAIVFAGTSGAGKSTLALRLAQRGWKLLADDVIIVDSRSGCPQVVPTEMPVRLWGDARHHLVGERARQGSAKRAVSLHEAGISYARQPARLHSLYFVSEASRRPLVRVTPRAAVAALMEHAFVLAADDRQSATRLFHQASDVVRATRVFRLPAPPEFVDLDRVLDAVMLAAGIDAAHLSRNCG